MDNVIPEEVRRILGNGISSMDHVDVLFHLSRGAATNGELTSSTRFSEKLVDTLVERLVADGFVVRRGDKLGITESEPDRRAIASLLEIYNARPVTLVRAIYARELFTRTVSDALNPRLEKER
jgi:DNA-binding HxlR family transcriptional regulator